MGRYRPSVRSRLVRCAPFVVCLLALAPPACSPPSATPPATDRPDAPDAGYLNQWRKGRDPRELARTWYFTPQGSHLLDFDVFMAIARPFDAVLFSAQDNLESYGFLYPYNYEESARGTSRAFRSAW
jgi:hypothetical protein